MTPQIVDNSAFLKNCLPVAQAGLGIFACTPLGILGGVITTAVITTVVFLGEDSDIEKNK